MRKLRFNIASLLSFILVFGVGIAALRESIDLWENGVFTLTLAALLISILLAIHRSEKRRSFWIGFALFGWAYLGLSLVPSIESRLMTTKYLDSNVPGRPPGAFTVRVTGIGTGTSINQTRTLAMNAVGNDNIAVGQGGVWIYDRTTGKFLNGWSGTTENFVRIGHSLLSLIAGILGGQLSRHFYPRYRESTTI